MKIETVTIVADNAKGRRIINKSDFDEKVHTLFGAEKPAPKKPAAKKPAPKKAKAD